MVRMHLDYDFGMIVKSRMLNNQLGATSEIKQKYLFNVCGCTKVYTLSLLTYLMLYRTDS